MSEEILNTEEVIVETPVEEAPVVVEGTEE
jgi:hypothetical protein